MVFWWLRGWASMSTIVQREIQSDQKSVALDTTASHRRRPLSVLFMHRDADVVDCCVEELKKARFTVSPDSVLTIAQCTQQLRLQTYDVVVAEYPSPNWKGSQTLQLLRQTVQEIPLLFVTTALANESIAELTAHGAFDYVEREHVAQLPMAIRRALNEKELRAELEEARKALRHSQSLYRALADNPAYGIGRCGAEGKFLDVNQALASHRRLFEALHAEICRSKRTEREFSLLLLDLDGLKEINDRYGHQVGDRALCRLSNILVDCCRSIDTAARQGGDEFALVLPETEAAAATLVARRICDLLAKDSEEPTLSVSVGVASWPNEADTVGTLIYAADRALYVMKDKRPRAARASHG